MRIPLTSLCLTQGRLLLFVKKLSFFLPAFLFCFSATSLYAEGSKDFINYPGYRMFLDTREAQQLKTHVNAHEYLNIGSSHLGIQGGFIKIYRPDGVLHATLTGNAGNQGIIFNKTQEVAGPTGGGTSGGSGYEPWSYKVPNGEEGVWSVHFGYPTYTSQDFPNLLNNADWNRARRIARHFAESRRRSAGSCSVQNSQGGSGSRYHGTDRSGSEHASIGVYEL